MPVNKVVSFVKARPLVFVVNILIAAGFAVLIYVGNAENGGVEALMDENISVSSLEVNAKGSGIGEGSPAYEKPIFHPDRHPIKATPAPVAQVVSTPFTLNLTGIMSISDTLGYAFFRDSSGTTSYQVGLGESIQGWTLEKLTRDEAVLVKGDEKKSLSMATPLGSNPTVSESATQDTQGRPRTRKKR